jgi:hypothetical protein
MSASDNNGALPPLIQSDSAVSGILASSGLSEFVGPVSFLGPVTITSTTPVLMTSLSVTGTSDSVSATSGSLVVAGGVGITKSLTVGGTIVGNQILPSGSLFVGSSASYAVARTVTGDASVSNVGALTLSSVVTAGTYTSANISIDAKGRVVVASSGTSGSPAGTNGALQYYSNGAFAGDTSMNTNGSGAVTLVSLTSSGSVSAGSLVVGGSIMAGTTITAASGVIATTGNVTASAGNVVATLGAVSAGTTVTAGTGIVSTSGNITASSGSVVGVGHVYSSKASYTQITSNVTAVPITTNAGTVTTFNLTNATTASIAFTLTGGVILSGSQLMLTKVAYSGTPYTNGVPFIFVTSVVAGTATITISNYAANALSGTVSFYYIIV